MLIECVEAISPFLELIWFLKKKESCYGWFLWAWCIHKAFVKVQTVPMRVCLVDAHASLTNLGLANCLAQDFATAGSPTTWRKNWTHDQNFGADPEFWLPTKCLPLSGSTTKKLAGLLMAAIQTAPNSSTFCSCRSCCSKEAAYAS